MKKYNLEELKRIPIDQPFDDDVNYDAFEQIDKINETFNAQVDIAGMMIFEKPGNKFYGTFYAIGHDLKPYGEFEFIKGVCYKWKLVRYFGNSQAWVERYNKNVYKPKRTRIGENDTTPTQSEEQDA